MVVSWGLSAHGRLWPDSVERARGNTAIGHLLTPSAAFQGVVRALLALGVDGGAEARHCAPSRFPCAGASGVRGCDFRAANGADFAPEFLLGCCCTDRQSAPLRTRGRACAGSPGPGLASALAGRRNPIRASTARRSGPRQRRGLPLFAVASRAQQQRGAADQAGWPTASSARRRTVRAGDAAGNPTT